MMKLLLAAVGIAAAGILLFSPKKKTTRDTFVRPRKPPPPPPSKLAEPTKPPEGWRAIFEDGLIDAVATCAARELPETYDEAVVFVKACALDLIFPAYSWPPRSGDRQWKRNLWSDDGLYGAVRAALQNPDVPGP